MRCKLQDVVTWPVWEEVQIVCRLSVQIMKWRNVQESNQV